MLKEIFQSKGVKQKWLAEKMGVSEVTMSNWVTNKSIPSKKHMERISEILDIPLNELIL
jgi:transcriptional regulator with XRE-family HTH domain